MVTISPYTELLTSSLSSSSSSSNTVHIQLAVLVTGMRKVKDGSMYS